METSSFGAVNARVLEHHFLFRSRDLDYTKSVLSKLYRAHGLAVSSPNRGLDVTARFARLHRSSISYLNYGTEVMMRPPKKECLEDFLIVQIPIRGTARVSCGNETITSNTSLASVVTPSLPLEMDWSEDCSQITLRFERSCLERHCEKLLGHPINTPLRFGLGMQLDSAGGRRWLRLVKAVLDDLDENRDIPALVAKEWEQALMTHLLAGHPNTYLEQLLKPVKAVSPRFIRRVEEHIHANADKPLTVQDMAEVAHVSVRSVYAGFRRFYGMSPSHYLRSVRLDRVRVELQRTSSSSTRVTEVAIRWGFTHLGRFSQEYQKRFGEAPSETLRR